MVETLEILEQADSHQQQTASAANGNEQNPLVSLFTIRKGLVVAWILPCLTTNENIRILPQTCKTIRQFKYFPKEERQYFNCVYTDLLRYAANLSIKQNQMLCLLSKANAGLVVKDLLEFAEFEQPIVTDLMRKAGSTK